MTKKLQVGIVGGGIGSYHIRAFQTLPEQFEVAAICDIDEARAKSLAETYHIPHATTSLTDLCRLSELDVVDLCTPPYLHFDQAQEALAAGKHIILEKPHVGSLQEVDRLIALEAESNQRIMPVFQYRYGHGLQKLKLLIAAGLAGRAYLTTVETSWRRGEDYYAVPWRGKWATELGGVLTSMAIHAHDLLYYVLGPVKSVFARAKTLVNPIEVDDCVSASLEMADGSLASLSATTGSPAQISRHRFCFSRLTAESNTQPYTNTADPWTFTGDSPEIQTEIETALAGFKPLPEGYAGQFYRYHQALGDNTELPVTLADARVALELLTALYHSAETGQGVELPLSNDHPKYAGWQPKQNR
ncbi:MAG: gfo/Idh/MocA family oxidoreductase [Anaerolineae bacterium]|nr:Gfo/Idh/MocA family oxidoreductase [Anaerolineales bacterium]MCQ3974101.1 gfo/Idh/MocA family oxidoreductase [Anaerolineae bacterium]